RLYWVAGRETANPYVAKALLAWSRLTGRGDDSALIVLYTPIRGSDESARQALRSFAQAMAKSIDQALAAGAVSRR
ncbi:MAG: exosortase C-terminal domain/associated protein EpsI, partial [Casimicrobiaceae bacterium]